MNPPRPAQRPHPIITPHGTRTDPYYWMRDDERKAPDVIAHLEAENAYYAAQTAHTEPLKEALYSEILSHIQQDDTSVPYRQRGWWYQTRYVMGQEHPIHVRWRDGEGPESARVMLDVNRLAEGQAFYQVGALAVSDDDRWLAVAEDRSGRRQFAIRILDLERGEFLADELSGASSSMVWDAKGGLYWVQNDPETLRSRWVLRHERGAGAGAEPGAGAIYQETDETFYVGVGRTTDDAWVLIQSQSTVSSEVRAIPADGSGALRVLAARERDLEYDADHLGRHWLIRTNRGAVDFCLVHVPDEKVPESGGQVGDWKVLIPPQEGVYIAEFLPLRDWLVIGERAGGMLRLRARRWDGSREFLIPAEEPVFTMWLGTNPEPDTTVLQYGYASLTTPSCVFSIDLAQAPGPDGALTKTLLKQQPVPNADLSALRSARQIVKARDGAEVAVSLVWKEGAAFPAPVLLYGYGAYGLSMDPSFSAARLPLLDRGVVFAIAHIRGGQEQGRRWYDNGRTLNKKNSFTDFVDVADALVREGWQAADGTARADGARLCAMGGSAGGLLVGAAINLGLERFRAVVAQVPFVDTLTTMLDESIPLTTNEYDEWGNPNDEVFYKYIESYSPMDNLPAGAWPALLVTSGLWDSQVQYFEPAKWVARIRDVQTGGGPVLMHMEMSAGHGGKSGRYQRYREVAREYAFILDQVGAGQPEQAA